MTKNQELPHPPAPGGRIIDARLHLLSRQVHDVDDAPVTTVDDLELVGPVAEDAGPGAVADGTRPAYVHALLSGAALATRVLGGRAPDSRWHRIPWSLVTEVGTLVRLGTRGEDLDVTWTERWIRDRLIARIPGGKHDPQ
ncbi:hypothetical protein GCM10010401_06180 [Rarobacter faecitabidus]|uniref:Uncharacterized protein n=1 Tax=Rarobacter faecitabidus TaxID=13243 RepID=A0A542ZTG3_RARFA|nr:hypothetical protein [Rarobacter faecitabidus]TQL63631.1 hypothetical protein FB461_0098 [Rarobacter faecitabidus]